MLRLLIILTLFLPCMHPSLTAQSLFLPGTDSWREVLAAYRERMHSAQELEILVLPGDIIRNPAYPNPVQRKDAWQWVAAPPLFHPAFTTVAAQALHTQEEDIRHTISGPNGPERLRKLLSQAPPHPDLHALGLPNTALIWDTLLIPPLHTAPRYSPLPELSILTAREHFMAGALRACFRLRAQGADPEKLGTLTQSLFEAAIRAGAPGADPGIWNYIGEDQPEKPLLLLKELPSEFDEPLYNDSFPGPARICWVNQDTVLLHVPDTLVKYDLQHHSSLQRSELYGGILLGVTGQYFLLQSQEKVLSIRLDYTGMYTHTPPGFHGVTVKEISENATMVNARRKAALWMTHIHSYPLALGIDGSFRFAWGYDKEYEGGIYDLATGLCVEYIPQEWAFQKAATTIKLPGGSRKAAASPTPWEGNALAYLPGGWAWVAEDAYYYQSRKCASFSAAIRSAAFSPDGQHLLLADYMGHAWILSLKNPAKPVLEDRFSW